MIVILGLATTRPLVNLVKVSTSMASAGLEYELVANLFPLHRRDVAVALDRLSQMVDAVSNVVLTRRVLCVSKYPRIDIRVECLAEAVQAM